MKTTNLKKYIEERNLMNRMFRKGGCGAEYSVEFMTRGAKKELLEQLECDLSPENLARDGERPMAQIRSRARMLTAAKKELEVMVAP
jgi:hypothetical protein